MSRFQAPICGFFSGVVSDLLVFPVDHHFGNLGKFTTMKEFSSSLFSKNSIQELGKTPYSTYGLNTMLKRSFTSNNPQISSFRRAIALTASTTLSNTLTYPIGMYLQNRSHKNIEPETHIPLTPKIMFSNYMKFISPTIPTVFTEELTYSILKPRIGTFSAISLSAVLGQMIKSPVGQIMNQELYTIDTLKSFYQQNGIKGFYDNFSHDSMKNIPIRVIEVVFYEQLSTFYNYLFKPVPQAKKCQPVNIYIPEYQRSWSWF